MLFLHGYMSCKESFYYNIKEFEKHFRVTAPDFPGFGASSPIPAAWSVSDYADWLEQFIALSRLSSPHIVAHSFGARVAIKLAARRSDILDKLVITGGAGLVKPRTRAYKAKVAAYRLVKKIAPRFAEKKFGSSEYRSLPPLMRESYRKIVNEDLRADAAKIKSPALLLYGDKDTVTPAGEEGSIFAAAIDGARLETISGGHFCFSQNSKEFNSKVIAFLNGEREK